MNRTLAAMLAAALFSAPAAGAQVLSVQDLGTLGGPWSAAFAVDAGGRAVGSSLTAQGETHAFLWTPERGMVDLGTLGGTWSEARGINALGQIVGVSTLPPDDISGETYHAFLWEHGKMQDLGSPSAFPWVSSYAEAIDASGRIVGSAPFGHYARAFRWSAQDGFVDLGVADSSHAYATSDLGVVVGTFNVWTGYSEGPPLAFAWKDGVTRPLSTPAGDKFSWAYGVNAAEQVVGCSRSEDLFANPAFSALLWSGDSALQIFPGVNACARGINDHGQVVGFWDEGAFVWSAATGPLVLAGPGGSASIGAYAVNDRGEIAGASAFGPAGSGEVHATLWTVSTPSSGGDTIRALIADVQGLASAGALGAGQGKALIAKLDAAAARLAEGQAAAAASVLRAFQLQVEAFVKAGVLTEALAGPLRIGAGGVGVP